MLFIKYSINKIDFVLFLMSKTSISTIITLNVLSLFANENYY